MKGDDRNNPTTLLRAVNPPNGEPSPRREFGKLRSSLSDRIGSFVAIPQAFVDDATISHEAFRLFVVLRSYTSARSSEQVAFPDYDTIKARTGIGNYTKIARAIRDLESAGWLERRKRFGQSTVYTLCSPTDANRTAPPTSPTDVCRPVLHTSVGQSYTRRQANKRYSTRGTQPEQQQAPAAASVVVPVPPDADTTDTTLDAPPVRALFDLTRVPLTYGQRSLIIGAVKDMARWREVVEYWVGRKWGPENVAGMLDLYANWDTRKPTYTPPPARGQSARPGASFHARKGARPQVQYTDEMRARKEREAAALLAAEMHADGGVTA